MKFLVSPVLALLLAGSAAQAAAPGSMAVFGTVQVRCGICHMERLPVAEGAVNFAEVRSDRAGGEGICYSCHNGVVKDSRALLWERFQHPVGVRPRDAEALRKTGFPLDDRGRLTCGSCHTPHVKTVGVGFFMRFGDEGGTFCRRCHPTHTAGVKYGEHPVARGETKLPPGLQTAGGKLGEGQRIVCGTCHRVHGASSAFLLAQNPWGKEGLCQGCHGQSPQRQGAGPGSSSHPVNVKVGIKPSSEWSRDGVSLSPALTVDCWSCHRAHNTAEDSHLLVMEIFRGNGCVRCHAEQSSFTPQKGNHPVAAAGPGGAGDPKVEKVKCLSCHRAHNSYSQQRYLLVYDRSKPNFCWKCHPDRVGVNRNHPLETLKGWEPVGKLEALGAGFGPGRTIVCTTCHRVHGALPNTHGLLAGEKMLCLYCHPQQNPLDSLRSNAGTHPILVPAGKGLPPEIAALGGRLGPGGELLCTTCHRAHDSKTPGAGLIMEREKFSCTACHRKYDGMRGGRHARAAAGGTPTTGGETPGPDPTRDICQTCHKAHGWSRDVPDGKDDFASRLCLSCHGRNGEVNSKYPLDISHPLGVKLSGDKGMGLPLPFYLTDGRRFKRGMVSCLTCHDVHADTGGADRYFLRIPASGSQGLCVRCHPEKNSIAGTKHDLRIMAPEEINIIGAKASDGGVCSPCHLAHGGFEKTMWARLPGSGGDRSAQLCLGCHGEGLPASTKAVGEFSHPVKSEEPVAEGTSGTRRAASRAVTCTTCHDPHVWNRAKEEDRGGAGVEGGIQGSFLKVVDDADSTLCLGCHPAQGSVAGTVHDLRRLKSDGRKSCLQEGREASLCGSCHKLHGGQGPFGSPFPPLQGKDPISGLCVGCHAEEGCAGDTGQHTHPLGMKKLWGEQGTLPFYDERGRKAAQGTVTCATCHEAHVWRPGPSASGPADKAPSAGNSSFLRMRSDENSPLCVECHPQQGLVTGTDHDLRVTAGESRDMLGRLPREAGVCGVCHTAHRGAYAFFLWNWPLGPGSDMITNVCTGCHNDGQVGRKPGRFDVHYKSEWGKDVNSPKMVFAFRRSSKDEEPALMLYDEESLPAYRGIVTCVTCHNPHKWDSSKAAPGNGTPEEGDMGNSFLRIRGTFSIRNSFCSDCHPHDTVDRFQYFHKAPEAAKGSP